MAHSSPTLFKSGLYYKSNQRSINATNTNRIKHDRGRNFWSKNFIFLPHTSCCLCIWQRIRKNRKMVECNHITTHQQVDRQRCDNWRSVTNLPRQFGLGGYNEYIKRNLSLHSDHHLIMNPQAHRSTEELKTIVKALSKLRFLNTPEEDQRLFECEEELRKRKREDDFINAHFQVITY